MKAATNGFLVVLTKCGPRGGGEWWNEDVLAIEEDTIKYGGGPNVSNAYTVNGLPGPLYPCSTNDTFMQGVERGKNNMLRIIKAALNDELFFTIANHTLAVVEIDAAYVKAFTTRAIMIAQGQTTTVLFTADQASDSKSFATAATPYVTAIVPFDGSTTIGFINYEKKKAQNTPIPYNHTGNFSLSFLPPTRDTPFSTWFSNKLRSLDSSDYPCKVPKAVDKQVFLTISPNLQDCPLNQILHHLHNVELLSYFPENPPHPYNYTGAILPDANMNPEFGNKLLVVPYGTRLEFVLQDTSFINVENHPIHIHGHNFFIVGSGFGNFDPEKDPAGFHLVDPPERNTVAVPSGGWAVIWFKANNPGVWFMHCHLEVHTTWGLAMAFIVENGPKPSQSILPPPKDYPPC
ncbi:hypothetical protein AAC387_Pa06g1039 [Persea americana]